MSLAVSEMQTRSRYVTPARATPNARTAERARQAGRLPRARPVRPSGPGPQHGRRAPRVPQRLLAPAQHADVPAAGLLAELALPVPRLGVHRRGADRAHPRRPVVPAVRPR